MAMLASGKPVQWLIRNKLKRHLSQKRWGQKHFRETCRFWQRKHNRSWVAERQLKLHAKGLCIRCGKPAGGCWNCANCRVKIQVAKKIWRDKRRERGEKFM
jgi:hypothetical protein